MGKENGIYIKEEINEWYEVGLLENNVFAINEHQHTEDVYSYLILGENRDLLIDTGMGIKPIKPVLNQFRDSSKDLIVVNTHYHFDHIGGNKEFESVLVSANDREIEKYKEGDREIEVIETPGHTPGSISFFDKTYGLLFPGDFLYEGPLYAFEEENNIEDYLNSLYKISKYPIKTIHPGHNHSSNKDYPNLINEAIKLFERVTRREKPENIGIFSKKVEYFEYHHPGSKRRLKVLVKYQPNITNIINLCKVST